MNIFLSAPQDEYLELLPLAAALSSEGMRVSLVDWIRPGQGSPGEEILSAIKRCDVFVALLDKVNPNVMFELGYALGSGKRVLLLYKSEGNIPLDIASFPAVLADSLDERTISEIVKWVKDATVKSRLDSHSFQTAHQMLGRMCEDESFLDEVEPRKFEECINNVLLEKGFASQLMPLRNDGGVDIEIDDFSPGALAVVEVKKQNRNSKLSVSEVQRVLGAAVASRARFAIIVTAGGFTASARFFADSSPIRIALLTIDELFGISRDELISRLCTNKAVE